MAFKRGRSFNRKPPSDSEDQPRLLSPERQEQRARNVLLHQLARSAKSTSQLRKILQEREIDSAIAEQVIERFTEVGLIDDAAYAEVIVNSRRNIKGLAKSAIKRELAEKGVGANLIEEATNHLTQEDDLESAKVLAVKRIGQMTRLEKEVRRRRLAGYLQRKGYSTGCAFEAIKYAELELNLDR